MSDNAITIIGGGLAGCEAAYQALKLGARVRLFEMKPVRFSPAHNMEGLAELVCSNSLKSEDPATASGLLKEEMRLIGSLILSAAGASRVPAGSALAVDREEFSRRVTGELLGLGCVIERGEVTELPQDRPLVIATGPLTSDAFAPVIQGLVGRKALHFYDAVAPIVYSGSIDMTVAFRSSRYGKGGDDYINCPLTKEEYERFVSELLAADSVAGREFEEMKSFEGCMPIEAMASRGPDTLMFGPMRPTGLTDPATGRRPHAVVQLRRENLEGTLYNMVGFQTRLKYPEQKRVFRLIPGLKDAEFARLGKLHRNSYIDSPGLLDSAQRLVSCPGVFFAGQITGVEGYCESAMSGMFAGINAARASMGMGPVTPPAATICGALLEYISKGPGRDFQPMNANMGLLPEMKGKDRRERQSKAALEAFARWRDENLAKS